MTFYHATGENAVLKTNQATGNEHNKGVHKIW